MSDATTHNLHCPECPTEQMIISSQDTRKRSQETFLCAVGHELKNAATAIKLTTQRQSKWAEQCDNTHVLHWCKQLDRQVTRMTNLINDLLDFSRMQVDKFQLCTQPFFLDQLVEEIVEDFQGIAPTHRFFVEGQQDILVYADKERIGQVLINLLTNAVKHSPQAAIVRISVTSDQAHALVRIQDFGVGIAAAHHERIFEPFYQVNATSENSIMGLGLGLYLVCEFIERHQGKIWVESEPGKGATFIFKLPLSQQTSKGGECYTKENDSHRGE